MLILANIMARPLTPRQFRLGLWLVLKSLRFHSRSITKRGKFALGGVGLDRVIGITQCREVDSIAIEEHCYTLRFHSVDNANMNSVLFAFRLRAIRSERRTGFRVVLRHVYPK